MQELEEDIADLSGHILFKEKRCAQAEVARNYKIRDDLTHKISDCKVRKRELDHDLKLLHLKDVRSRRRQQRMRESEYRSRFSTPMPLASPQSPGSLQPLSPSSYSESSFSSHQLC